MRSRTRGLVGQHAICYGKSAQSIVWEDTTRRTLDLPPRCSIFARFQCAFALGCIAPQRVVSCFRQTQWGDPDLVLLG